MRRIARLREDDGTTIIEMVIAASLFSLILFSVFSVLDSGTRAERGAQSRTEALLNVRQAIGSITKEVRQADEVSTASTRTRLQITRLDGASVIYELSAGQLMRRVGSNPNIVLLDRVTSTLPFCFDPPACVVTTAANEPSSIRVDLSTRPDVSNAEPVTLATDVQLRNL